MRRGLTVTRYNDRIHVECRCGSAVIGLDVGDDAPAWPSLVLAFFAGASLGFVVGFVL